MALFGPSVTWSGEVAAEADVGDIWMSDLIVVFMTVRWGE
jgi:hypothetical protein